MPETLLIGVNEVRENVSATLSPVRLRHRATETIEPDAASLDGAAEIAGDMNYTTTNDLLNRIPAMRVGENSLADELRFEGASMWQFLPSYIWSDVFRAVETAKCLAGVLAKERPARLTAVPTADRYSVMWMRLSEQAAEAHGIPHRALGDRVGRRRPFSGLGPRSVLAATTTKRAEAVGRRLGSGDPGPGRRALFAGMKRHWVPDPRNPGERWDEQLSPLLDALGEAGLGPVIALDCPYDGPTDVDSLRSRRQAMAPRVDWRTFGTAGPVSRSRRRLFARRCHEWWQVLSAENELTASLALEGIRLFPALDEVLEGAIKDILTQCLAMREQARMAIEQIEPECVLATYETGPYARALLIESARAGIPSVGLQHGMIFENNYDYMHAGTGTDPASSAFTVPGTTCVWGDLWRDALTGSGSYPPDAVSVTGNWRYDAIGAAQGSPESGRAALGLAEEEPELILACSGAQESLRFVEAVGRATANADVVVRVRPHPSEDEDELAAALTAAGGPAGGVTRDGDLADVLAAASVVVSQLSTVIAEALLADRSVIVADFAEQEGWSLYKESPACLVASNPAELAAAIARVRSDPDLRARMTAARAELVERLFGPRDGRAPERVVRALAS